MTEVVVRRGIGLSSAPRGPDRRWLLFSGSDMSLFFSSFVLYVVSVSATGKWWWCCGVAGGGAVFFGSKRSVSVLRRILFTCVLFLFGSRVFNC
jgi:hypothetical protein